MRFVEVGKYKFVCEPRYYFFGWSRSPKILGRKSAVEALVRARKLLPKGYNFKIWDCQRPRAVQLAMIASFRRRFSTALRSAELSTSSLNARSLTPVMRRAEIEKLVFKFAAKPLKVVTRLDTHRNGGSFDLTIINRKGEELYMGTDHDDLTEIAATDYFESKRKLSPREQEAKKNRKLLMRVLLKVGFINYTREWWHWSWLQP